MRKHHITFLLFFAIILMFSCGGFFDGAVRYECYATNVITLFEKGVPIDTINLSDTQRTIYRETAKVKEKYMTKGPLSFSKDSALKFFHPYWEFKDKSSFYEKYGKLSFSKDCGVIAMQHELPAPTLFITPEGYKHLELCDYDSVTMFYTFDRYRYNSQSDIDALANMGYKFH